MPRHASRCCFNKNQVVVAIVFSIWNIALWGRQEYPLTVTILKNDSVLHHFDEEKCFRSLISSTTKIATELFSKEQQESVAHFAAKVVVDHKLRGDYVEVDASSSSSCGEIGAFGLIISTAQRSAIKEPFCNLQMAPKRAVWLAFRDERCIEVVSKMFQEKKFSVLDPNVPRENNGIVDVPIHLLAGPLLQTLSKSPVEKIALLRIGHPLPREMGEIASSSSMVANDEHLIPADDQVTTNTLHALISLYRKVGIGGYVALEGVWFDEVKEFLIDGNHTILNVSADSYYFMKADTQIRVPVRYRQSQIQPVIDPGVLQAWHILDGWHKETVKRFVGHVGTNPYQTYRYIEAMRQVVDNQKRSGDDKKVTVNVCETGFNGGHSAMLFLSFLNSEQGINVNYWGWDIKKVGSASPIASKMTERYSDHFHIVWGDSKVTLKEAKNEMGDQLCHLIVVDGDHSKEGVVNDVRNFLEVAAPEAILFGDDCAPYKRTVPQSEKMLEGWMEFVKNKSLISVANYRNPELPSPGFVEGIVSQINTAND